MKRYYAQPSMEILWLENKDVFLTASVDTDFGEDHDTDIFNNNNEF